MMNDNYQRVMPEPPRSAPAVREDHAARTAVPWGEPRDDRSLMTGKLWEGVTDA